MGVCGTAEDKQRKVKQPTKKPEDVGESVAKAEKTEEVKVEVKPVVNENPIGIKEAIDKKNNEIVDQINAQRGLSGIGGLNFPKANNEPLRGVNPPIIGLPDSAGKINSPELGGSKNVNLKGQPQIGEEYKVSEKKIKKIGDLKFEYDDMINQFNGGLLRSCINNNSLTPAYCANKEREAREHNNIIKRSCIGYPEPDEKLDELETKHMF